MKLALRFLILSILASAMSACPERSKCLLGQEVVIPSSDATAPSVVMDIHLPDGKVQTVYTAASGTLPSNVFVPVKGGGQVTIIVNAKDSLGIRDVQIWATPSGGGTPSAPIASNKDSGKAGEKGCTERVANINLTVSKSPIVVSFDVRAVGVNFGGITASPPVVRLEAQ
jgi:hypothetical protein